MFSQFITLLQSEALFNFGQILIIRLSGRSENPHPPATVGSHIIAFTEVVCFSSWVFPLFSSTSFYFWSSSWAFLTRIVHYMCFHLLCVSNWPFSYWASPVMSCGKSCLLRPWWCILLHGLWHICAYILDNVFDLFSKDWKTSYFIHCCGPLWYAWLAAIAQLTNVFLFLNNAQSNWFLHT